MEQMEQIIKLINTIVLAFLGYWLILPVVKNELEDYHRHHPVTLHFYKLSCAIIIFNFVANIGDLVFNFGKSYFLISVLSGWSAIAYCIYYWVNDILSYESK